MMEGFKGETSKENNTREKKKLFTDVVNIFTVFIELRILIVLSRCPTIGFLY